MRSMDGTSPPLTLRPHMYQGHTETHVVSYAQHFESAGGGSAPPHVLDVSEPSANAMTLLRGMESVYFQSMSSEDEKNKMLREKMHAEDHVRRLIKDKDDLARHLSQEKARRT